MSDLALPPVPLDGRASTLTHDDCGMGVLPIGHKMHHDAAGARPLPVADRRPHARAGVDTLVTGEHVRP